jgi:hypothetical protein
MIASISLPIESWFEIAKIAAIPLTVAIALLLLRPVFSLLLRRMTSIEIGPFEFDSGETEGSDVARPRTIVTEARKRIKENLSTGSKEKLENLRVALETEQVNQLIQYHANSLAQSRISFWFSIGAGTLGFIVILVGASTVMFGASVSSAVLGVTSGGIIDAVAALFFTQSNQARRLMTEFFDKLRLDRQFNESLRLCESISDVQIQSRLKAQLCLFFAGLPASVTPNIDDAPKTAKQSEAA